MASDSETLDRDSFRALAELAYRESGLTLVEEKVTMIQSRLRHRLRALKLPDFASYARFVGSDDGVPERKQLISALTTNVSHFFREDHHYSALVEEVFQPQLASLRAGNPVRIWSAGSSNGQEGYSAAISLLEVAPDVANLDLRILGTDIDNNVVRFANEGVYPERYVGGLSEARLSSYFTKTDINGETAYAVCPTLRKLVCFKELNLHASWPMQRRFDAIFCRNVVIYFDKPTQDKLWPRFRDKLTPEGYLFLGHSERIAVPEEFGLMSAGPTTYRRQSTT